MKKLIVSIILISVSLTFVFGQVRQPAVAGAFYPAEKTELEGIIKEFLKESKIQDTSGEILGVMVPHAGYVFSGGVASYSYKLLINKDIKTVVMIGPSHQFLLDYAAVYDKGSFLTPFGEVKINEKLAEKIIKSNKLIKASTEPHINEHSLEVQIPFLQKVLKDFTIVPILISHFDYEKCELIGKSLAKVLKDEKNCIILISTDLSHYPPYEVANDVDMQVLREIENLNPISLINLNDKIMKKGYKRLLCTLCGFEGVITGIVCLKELGVSKAIILKYANSGDTKYGDKEKVVGYGAVAFIKETQYELSDSEKKELLLIARESIESFLKDGKVKKFNPKSKALHKEGAAFVTLRKNGNLRGCIGHLVPQLPLYETVSQMALAAAFRDFRFPSVTREELKDIKIEISVLSPLKRINDIKEIKMGKHGVVVEKGGNSGVFLPQVAEETGWTKEEFLNHLCSDKAGLSPNAWQDKDTAIYIFTVIKFEEE
jgi:AmmeMemoRadiSam system protein B/AmmeMemoRadiSam system protein A